MATKENSFINSLQKMDLNLEEAQIYFTLLKYGQTGAIVRKLREELPDIERTTIYSILKRLTEKDCVESKQSEKLKTYFAIDPTQYFNKIFLKKKQEFNELQEIKSTVLQNLQNIYNRGLVLSNEELDPLIFPYLQSLLDVGWKIKTQKINKGINILGGEMYYEYHIQPPRKLEKKIQILGLMISIYDSKIEDDDATLKFVFKQIKKTIKELHREDFKNIEIMNGEIEVSGENFPSLIIRARDKKSEAYLNFGSTAILPIKNKIFFMWEELIHDNKAIDKIEQQGILKEFIKPILEIEGNTS
jgi:predicted transcriptional regulator